MEQLQDITGEIGPLYESGRPSIPMYSFDRPATILWQAVYDAMRAAGCTHEQAAAWLMSKRARWILDSEMGEQLRAIGHDFGLRCAPAARAA